MRKNYFIFVCLLMLSCSAQSQELVLTSKVAGDSISIKWLPNNFEQYKLIANGATVFRIQSAQTGNFENLDFKSAKTWDIDPVKSRMKNLDLTTTDGQKIETLLEPIYSSTTSDELMNFAFGTALIENVVNPKFQYILGNIIVDKEFDESKPYVYKVAIKGLEDSYIAINPKLRTKYSDIDDLTLKLDQKKTVDLEWSANRYEKEAFGFEIEHSMDEIVEGEYINETPFLPFKSEFEKKDARTLYRDAPKPGHLHYYRIHGRDLFGHKSLISDWKKIYVPLLINAWVEIDTIYAKDQQRVINGLIHSFENSANINAVSLLRSLDRGTNYEMIQTASFSDSSIQFILDEKSTGDHFYYKILLTNKDDSVLSTPRYFFTLDQVPPKPPTNISGAIDSNGIVKLNWIKSVDQDILGYRVFRANSKSEEFVEKTSKLEKQPIFIDTLSLNNLTSEVYYSVQAVDLNYNQSIQSDTILLLKPDTIAPVPAVINSITYQDNGLKIEWTNSNSEDVKMNYLFRRYDGKGYTLSSWSVPIDSSSDIAIEYEDTIIAPAYHYQYQIQTIDENGNRSLSNTISKYYEPGYRKPLNNFEAKVSTERKVIVLKWLQPRDGVYSYQIFRGKTKESLLQLKTITDGSVTQFEDKNVRINNKYVYSIKYVNNDGIHSIPTKVEVIYQ